MASRFTQLGIAFVSANYRLHPKATFPDYLDDAAATFAFIRSKILDYGGDPNFVFLSGHSAGGYLCAMVGMNGQYLARYGLKPSDIAGVMPVAGQMITHSTVRKERRIAKTTPVIDAAAPLNHVRKEAPPFLNIVGSQDLPARAEENRYFVAAMRAAGHPDVTYLEVDGRNHMTIASEIGAADDPVGAVMLAFMNRLRP